MFVFAEIVICSQVDLREARAALEKRRQRRVRDARAAREVQRRQGAEFAVPPTDLELGASSSYGHSGYKPGRVGPVYTFVKTDPYAHVKWGVRHVAGKKYAGH